MCTGGGSKNAGVEWVPGQKAQRGYGDACRCGKGVDPKEHKCFLIQAILTKKRLICSTVAFSLLPPPSVESFNHVGVVKFQPWNGAFVQSFWRPPWSAGVVFLSFFFFPPFFLNGFFVPCPPPLPSFASVSDTIKGIGKDAGPAPARLREDCLTPLLPAVFYLWGHSWMRGGVPFHWRMVDMEPTCFLCLKNWRRVRTYG